MPPLSSRSTTDEIDWQGQPVMASRLLPRISFRALMIFMTISAVAIAVISAADQGGVYATAGAAGIGFMVGAVLIAAAVFMMTWAVSQLGRLFGIVLIVIGLVLLSFRLAGSQLGELSFLTQTIWLLNFQLVGWFLIVTRTGQRRDEATHNPFAADQLPPQIMAPRDTNS